MIAFSPSHWRVIAPMFFCIFFFSACSSSEGVDNYFTFNLEKTFSFSLTPGSAEEDGYNFAFTDSTDLASNGTSIDLIKSVKLTKLTFTSNQPPSSIQSVTDSLT